MKIILPAGDISIEIDQDDMREQIRIAVQEHVEYSLKSIVDAELRKWVNELVAERRDAILSELRPQVEKKLSAVRLDVRNY